MKLTCSGRKLVMSLSGHELDLKQKFIFVTDARLMKLRAMCVDNTDIGCSDHYLLWMELDRTTKITSVLCMG